MKPMEDMAGAYDADGAGRLLDVRRTDLHTRFFQTYQYPVASELLYDIEHLQLDQDAFAASVDARRYGYSGWLYWLMYLKGYTQYKATGVIDGDNVYYKYLTLRYAVQGADPTMRSLSTSPTAIERILRRFLDCDQLSEPGNATRYAQEQLAAVTAFVRSPRADEDTLGLYEINSSEPIWARLVDGHHRLFAARLFGVKFLRFETLVEPTSVPEVSGEVEHIDLKGSRLRMTGWISSPFRDVHCVEVRSNSRTICRAPLTLATEASLSTPEENGHRFTFVLDDHVSTLGDGQDALDVMVLRNWLPVGKLICNLS